MNPQEKVDTILKHLGSFGRMLSASKRAPDGETVFFNANVFDKDGNKLWFGDVNFSRDGKKLAMIADDLQEHFYVTREQPFRWSEQSAESLEKELRLDEGDELEEQYRSVIKVRPSIADWSDEQLLEKCVSPDEHEYLNEIVRLRVELREAIDLRRQADEVASCKQAVHVVLAERDALKAQVSALREALVEVSCLSPRYTRRGGSTGMFGMHRTYTRRARQHRAPRMVTRWEL